MGFAEGMSAGARAVTAGLNIRSQREEMELRKAEAAQIAELRALQIDEARRTGALNKKLDAANAGLVDYMGGTVESNTSGFSNPSAKMLYGQGGQQAVDDAASYANVENRRMGLPASYSTSSIAPPASPQGTVDPSDAVSYPVLPPRAPTISGLQVPQAAAAVGDAPVVVGLPQSAPTVQMRAFDANDPQQRIGMEQQMQRIAALKGDYDAIRKSSTEQRSAAMQGVISGVMKMSDDDIEKLAPRLNTNSSRLPLLYTGKGKGGYEFLTTGDGGEPGERFTLSKAQMRELAVAEALGRAGYGAEALDTLSKVDDKLHVRAKDWNEAMGKMQSGNNTATHYGNQDAEARARTGLAAAGLAIQRQRAAAATQNEKLVNLKEFVNEKGEVVMGLAVNTPQGVQFREVPMSPGLRLPPRGGVGKDFERLPEPGSLVQTRAGVRKIGEDGSLLSPTAPQPSERASLLQKSGLPPGLAQEAFDSGEMAWTKDGSGLAFRGYRYDPSKKSDVQQLRAKLTEVAESRLKSDEIARKWHADRNNYDAELQRQEEDARMGLRRGVFTPRLDNNNAYMGP